MSERIAVGDLVQVVRPTLCCGSTSTLGYIFRVDNFYSGPQGPRFCCHRRVDEEVLARREKEYEGWEISRLKRIPPLEELERETRKEEIEA